MKSPVIDPKASPCVDHLLMPPMGGTIHLVIGHFCEVESVAPSSTFETEALMSSVGPNLAGSPLE